VPDARRPIIKVRPRPAPTRTPEAPITRPPSPPSLPSPPSPEPRERASADRFRDGRPLFGGGGSMHRDPPRPEPPRPPAPSDSPWSLPPGGRGGPSDYTLVTSGAGAPGGSGSPWLDLPQGAPGAGAAAPQSSAAAAPGGGRRPSLAVALLAAAVVVLAALVAFLILQARAG
jgi:hypothetical protein